MDYRISELQDKEVVNITDGTRYGFIGDLEVDVDSGTVRSIVVPGKSRCLGLLGRKTDTVFPWTSIRRIGADIILVDSDGQLESNPPPSSERSQFFLKNR